MTGWLDLLFILVLVLDLYVLASSRLRAGIRAGALQGLILAALPVALAGAATSTGHVVAPARGARAVSCIGPPGLRARAPRGSPVCARPAPLVGFVPALSAGALGIIAA